MQKDPVVAALTTIILPSQRLSFNPYSRRHRCQPHRSSHRLLRRPDPAEIREVLGISIDPGKNI
jgi:hypothetical protein